MKLDAPLAVLADTIHAFPTSARVMGGVYQEAAAAARVTERLRDAAEHGEQSGLRVRAVRRDRPRRRTARSL